VPRRRKRGYPVAVLIGLENNIAFFWDVYSETIRPNTTIVNESNVYNFHEAIINHLRPKIKTGVKTVLVTSTNEKNYEAFYEHIKKHQKWLIAGYELNRVTIEYIEGSAQDLDSVLELIETSGLQRHIQNASYKDLNRIMNVLEKRLGTKEGIDTLLFSLNELENAIYSDASHLEYVLITTEFQKKHRRRSQRLLQVAQNKGIKSLTVDNNTPLGARLSQFGGLMGLLHQV
jgi:stalled ribosome rescue protein Dom34